MFLMHSWWKHLKFSKKKLIQKIVYCFCIWIHVKGFDCGYDMDTLGLKLIHKGYLDRGEINIVKLLIICQVNNVFEASSDTINLQKWREDVRNYIAVVL